MYGACNVRENSIPLENRDLWEFLSFWLDVGIHYLILIDYSDCSTVKEVLAYHTIGVHNIPKGSFFVV